MMTDPPLSYLIFTAYEMHYVIRMHPASAHVAMLEVGNSILDQLYELFTKHQGSVYDGCKSWKKLCDELFVDVRKEEDDESEHPFMSCPDAFRYIESSLRYSYGDILYLEYPRRLVTAQQNHEHCIQQIYTQDTTARWMWHLDLDACKLILVVGPAYIRAWPMKYFQRFQNYRFRKMSHTMFVKNACAIIIQTWWRRAVAVQTYQQQRMCNKDMEEASSMMLYVNQEDEDEFEIVDAEANTAADVTECDYVLLETHSETEVNMIILD